METREFRAAEQPVDGFVAIARLRIFTGDHPFVDFVAKLPVNVLIGRRRRKDLPGFVRYAVIEPVKFSTADDVARR